MGIQQSGINELLERMEILLAKSFSILPNYLVVVKVKEMEALIDRIYHNIPAEIQEARILLSRKDDFQLQAQQEAQRIITEAQQEAEKMLSESEMLRKVQREGDIYKDHVLSECDEHRKKAVNDAENIRIQAVDEANRIKDESEIYAEKTLAALEYNLTLLQQKVKEAQISMEKLRSENAANYNRIYPQKDGNKQSVAGDFVIE